MRVYIPSRGRADQRIFSGPAGQMTYRNEVFYVVSPDEAADYTRALVHYGVDAQLLCCDLQPDIARVREWCGLHAASDGLDKFVLCDDDVGFLVRRSADDWRLRGAEPDEVDEMLQWMSVALMVYDHVGVSAREGNNRSGEGGTLELVEPNTRIMRVQGFRTESFLKCEHGRVRVMEDFDIALQILGRGGSNAVSYWWGQGQRKTNDTGGCSEWRTHEVHEESARRLAELHPGLVTLRKKSNIGDRDGFGTRTEVTIQWKEAARFGKQRAAQLNMPGV